MALTLEAEQRLEDVGLITFYEQAVDVWKNLAKETHEFVTKNFPDGAKIRRDDVAKALLPLLEVNESLGDFLAEHKLTQKYWNRFFGDLILDRTWDEISA